MKLTEYYRGGRVFRGIEVNADELININQRSDYISVSKYDNKNIENANSLDIVGTIMGDINNMINDLDLFGNLNLKDKELPICENPDCWFVNKEYIKSNYKPLVPETLFTFGEAIELMKLGYAVARLGWNGRNMFLFLSTSEILDRIEDVTSKWSDYKIDPFIIMATAQKTFQPGWLASQADMLATDWVISKENYKK